MPIGGHRALKVRVCPFDSMIENSLHFGAITLTSVYSVWRVLAVLLHPAFGDEVWLDFWWHHWIFGRSSGWNFASGCWVLFDWPGFMQLGIWDFFCFGSDLGFNFGRRQGRNILVEYLVGFSPGSVCSGTQDLFWADDSNLRREGTGQCVALEYIALYSLYLFIFIPLHCLVVCIT